MIKANELRLNNIVKCKISNDNAKYIIVAIDGINGKVMLSGARMGEWIDAEKIKPIELTKDFFRKNKDATGWSEATEMIYIGFLDGAVWECEDNKGSVYVDICSYGHLEKVKHTHYVHELQNLYYAITKQELEVKAMKTELKHIVGYLPYKLKMKSPHGFRPNNKESTGTAGIVYLTGDLYADIENNTYQRDVFNPILRPMSDIVKPCLEDGKIPVEEIAKMHIRYDESKGDSNFKAKYSFKRQMRIEVTWSHPISKEPLYSDDLHIQTERTRLNEQWINNFLYQHHFDIHNLINQGLAIDVNTLQL